MLVRFLIRASIDLGLVGIVLLEFIVPYGMAEFIVYLKKKRSKIMSYMEIRKFKRKFYNPYGVHPKVALNGLDFKVEKGDFYLYYGSLWFRKDNTG